MKHTINHIKALFKDLDKAHGFNASLVPIKLNKRLKTTIARVNASYDNSNKVIGIEFEVSKGLLNADLRDCIFEDIIKHEYAHIVLNQNSLDHKHTDFIFNDLCRKLKTYCTEYIPYPVIGQMIEDINYNRK